MFQTGLNGAGGQKSDRRGLVRRQRGESETRMRPAAENFLEPASRVAILRSERGYLVTIYDVSSGKSFSSLLLNAPSKRESPVLDLKRAIKWMSSRELL